MRQVPTDDPLVTAVARQLEITMIQRAWIEDGILFIQDPYGIYEVAHETETDTAPAHTREPVDTLPHGGRNAPAKLTKGQPSSGGSADPPEPADRQAPGPEPPSEDTGLDDFTAIFGVGSVTAATLHDAGFYTYDDLRQWVELLPDLVGSHTASLIEDWLEERLF